MGLRILTNIKSLYEAVKMGYGVERVNRLTAYTEAVNKILTEDPVSYVANLEYIISNNIGLETLPKFMESYPLPLTAIHRLQELSEALIEKSESRQIPSKPYKELYEMATDYLNRHERIFGMYESYSAELPDCLAVYYDSLPLTEDATDGLLNKYGIGILADRLLLAKDVNYVLEVASQHRTCQDPIKREWLLECYREFNLNPPMNLVEGSLEYGFKNLQERRENLYRESVLMQADLTLEYTTAEIELIEDYIHFNEHAVLVLQTKEAIGEKNNLALNGYRELEHILPEGESTADLVDLLPQQQMLEESRHSKFGNIPGYLSKHHALGYGEDDDTDEDKKPEHYKRPEKVEPADEEDSPAVKTTDEPSPSATTTSTTPTATAQPSSNYYYNYYTTYKGSFNKSSDASTNVNSKNKNAQIHARESAPWELRLPFENRELYTESYTKHSGPAYYKTCDHCGANLDVGEKCDCQNLNESYKNINRFNPVPKNKTEINKFQPVPVEKNKIGQHDWLPEDDDDYEESFDLDQILLEKVAPEPEKPTSDSTTENITHTLQDLDRAMASKSAGAKKKANEVVNLGKVAVKPFKRTSGWINSLLSRFADANENNIKAKMADPKSRNQLISTLKKTILAGSLYKAGLLLNPIFLFLAVTLKIKGNRDKVKIRNQLIGELKQELEILDEKINDARSSGDRGAKYKLMRFRNKLQEKLVRVGGDKATAKVL